MATGDHDWVAGEVVTAANMDDYVQLQVVAQYATAAARDTALSARKREGMVTHQADVNTLTAYSGAAWSTVGPVHGALTAWTPVVTQGVTPTLTVTRATYARLGRNVSGDAVVVITSAGTAANPVLITMPVAMASSTNNTIVGEGWLYDASAGFFYYGFLARETSTTCSFWRRIEGAAASYLGSSGFTAAVANPDVVSIQFAYEAAADA